MCVFVSLCTLHLHTFNSPEKAQSKNTINSQKCKLCFKTIEFVQRLSFAFQHWLQIALRNFKNNIDFIFIDALVSYFGNSSQYLISLFNIQGFPLFYYSPKFNIHSFRAAQGILALLNPFTSPFCLLICGGVNPLSLFFKVAYFIFPENSQQTALEISIGPMKEVSLTYLSYSPKGGVLEERAPPPPSFICIFKVYSFGPATGSVIFGI